MGRFSWGIGSKSREMRPSRKETVVDGKVDAPVTLPYTWTSRHMWIVGLGLAAFFGYCMEGMPIRVSNAMWTNHLFSVSNLWEKWRMLSAWIKGKRERLLQRHFWLHLWIWGKDCRGGQVQREGGKCSLRELNPTFVANISHKDKRGVAPFMEFFCEVNFNWKESHCVVSLIQIKGDAFLCYTCVWYNSYVPNMASSTVW